jgi:hypothetical protein
MRFIWRRPIASVLALAVLVAAATTAEAQFGRRGFNRGFGNVRLSTPADVDGSFQFCRIIFNGDFRGDNFGGSWNVDWPRADINLSVRLSELTKTTVGRASDGEPNHLLMRLTDEVLYQCPFIMMTEVGSATFNEAEAAQLRNYLLKGGFLWADDFWGQYAWEWWEAQVRRVLPASEYPFVELSRDHSLFHSNFQVQKTPQIASINFWASNGGSTSERGFDSAEVHTRAILDRKGNIMVLATHNTDLGDSFEREGDDPEYFRTMSVPGYSFGINVLVYAMTH